MTCPLLTYAKKNELCLFIDLFLLETHFRFCFVLLLLYPCCVNVSSSKLLQGKHRRIFIESLQDKLASNFSSIFSPYRILDDAELRQYNAGSAEKLIEREVNKYFNIVCCLDR